MTRHPEEPRYRFNRATVRRFLGDLEGAEQDYDRVLEADPADAQAWHNRSELRVQTAERNHVADLERALAKAGPDWRRRVPLHFALAKEHEDLGEHAASWRHLAAGARLRRQNLRYDVRGDLETIDGLISAFGAIDGAVTGNPSREPIFIVGLPRTGSTLVDRILGRHPDVFCAGELPDLGAAVVAAARSRVLQRTGTDDAGAGTRAALVRASALLDFPALGADYLRRTRPRTGHTPRFTDKLPLNYLYCGHIARALPQAAIVHVRRHPLAVCYAMYKVLFDQGYPFSYDLGEIADYYLGYHRLMAHWHATLPGRIHDIRYEDLVHEPERESRRLLAGAGLSWDERCREPHRGGSAVMTASAAQVRRPIYTGSVGQWRHYAAQLEPVARRLRAAGIPLEE